MDGDIVCRECGDKYPSDLAAAKDKTDRMVHQLSPLTEEGVSSGGAQKAQVPSGLDLQKTEALPQVGIEEQVMSYINEKGAVSVAELYEALAIKNSSLTKAKLVEAITKLVKEGRADLKDIPLSIGPFVDYLRLWERNFWLYGLVTVSLATVWIINVVPSESPLIILRWILGSVFVLFIPGYVTLEALFTGDRQLDSIERFALSIGLSLASVSLVGLLLHYTPWGLTLTSTLIALTIFTVGLAIIAVTRRYKASTFRKKA